MPKKEEESIVLKEGTYVIRQDKHTFILNRVIKRRSGKHAGEEDEENICYPSSLANALQRMSEDMLRKKLKNNKDKTIEGVVKILDKHMKEVDKKFGTEIRK
jgi:hypothetical protein